MSDDPYLWLENIDGEDALNWVRERNEATIAMFENEGFRRMRAEALEVLDTDTRIPYVRRRGSTSTTSGATPPTPWFVAADHAGQLLHRRAGLGRHHRRRRTGPPRRRELGMGRRRCRRTRPTHWH